MGIVPYNGRSMIAPTMRGGDDMTVQEVIDRVDGVKPNAYTNADKLAWLNEIEGKVQTEIHMTDIDAVVRLESVTDELMVPFPYDSLYDYYMQAMIDFYNGEYDRYANTYEMFNEKWGDYEFWHSMHYPTRGSLERGVTKVGEK